MRYTRGFNNGYLMAEHEPILLSSILNGLSPSSDYLEGLFNGKEEYELERDRIRMDELSRLRGDSIDKDQDLERE